MDDMCDDLELCETYPVVYKVEIEHGSLEKVLQLFVDEILQGCPCSKAEAAIINYVTRVIDPVGWRAVWRATKDSLRMNVEGDFIVEVFNVSLMKLEADVIVKALISLEASEMDVSLIQSKIKTNSRRIVPLIELYPISEDDEDELFAKTAVTIEHARLFCKYLYRPWDEEEDVCFSEKLLRPRLQLYFDMKNKVLPEMMIAKINSILKEGWDVLNQLKTLYKDMNVSDSESELFEDDVLKTLDLRKKLEELQRKMDILENPVIRTLVMRKYIPYKSPQKQEQAGPFTYIVAPQISFGMILSLNLDPETLLRFDTSPENALKSSYDGDTVLIFPGHYRLDTLGWLDSNITVRGIGTNGSVQLEASGNSEVFLNCDSSLITFKNLTLKAAAGTVSTVVIHHGSVVMEDCVIDSDSAEVGITLLGGAELTLTESEVCNAKEDGIQLRMASTLSLNSSKVVTCGRNGIHVDATDDGPHLGPTTDVTLIDSHILSNEGYGMFITSSGSGDSSSDVSRKDFTLLNTIPWIKHRIENTKMSLNKDGEIGIANAFRPVKSISGFTYSNL